MRPIKSVSFIKNRQNHLLKDASAKFVRRGGGGERERNLMKTIKFLNEIINHNQMECLYMLTLYV